MPLAAAHKALRVPGKGKGRFRPRSGFDAELPDEVLALVAGLPQVRDAYKRTGVKLVDTTTQALLDAERGE